MLVDMNSGTIFAEENSAFPTNFAPFDPNNWISAHLSNALTTFQYSDFTDDLLLDSQDYGITDYLPLRINVYNHSIYTVNGAQIVNEINCDNVIIFH